MGQVLTEISSSMVKGLSFFDDLKAGKYTRWWMFTQVQKTS